MVKSMRTVGGQTPGAETRLIARITASVWSSVRRPPPSAVQICGERLRPGPLLDLLSDLHHAFRARLPLGWVASYGKLTAGGPFGSRNAVTTPTGNPSERHTGGGNGGAFVATTTREPQSPLWQALLASLNRTLSRQLLLP